MTERSSAITYIKEIMAARRDNMEKVSIDTGKLDIMKKDLFEQLRAKLPALQESDMDNIYSELKDKGDITLITNDIVTFEVSFLNQ